MNTTWKPHTKVARHQQIEAGVAECLPQGVANGLVTLRWGPPESRGSRRPNASGMISSTAIDSASNACCQPRLAISHPSTGTIRNCPNEPRCGHAHGPRAPLGRNLPAQYAVDHGVGGARLRCPDQEAGGECKQERGGRKRHARQPQAVQNGTAHQHAERAKPVGRHARKDPDHAPRQVLQRNRKSERLAGPPHLLGDGLQPQAKAVAHAHGQRDDGSPAGQHLEHG